MTDTSAIIRLAAGTLSASTILGSSSYLISNFPIYSDSLQREWLAYMEGGINDGVVIEALDGSGGLFGNSSGTLSFAWLSPAMLNYLFVTIFESKYINSVTMVVYHPRYGTTVVNCKLHYPRNIADIAEQSSEEIWTNASFTWKNGTITGNGFDSGFSTGFS